MVCWFTQNRCWNNDKMDGGRPKYIVVHSTAANNPSLKRYVQPSKDDKNYDWLMEKLGKNTNDNDWNRQNDKTGKKFEKCVHGFIGKLADGSVDFIATLPPNVLCWGCSKGKNGSYNKNPTGAFQFEICEDKLDDRLYFDEVYRVAVEVCAEICNLYEIPVENIFSHKEAGEAGMASGHTDPDYWFQKFGKSMDTFRADVQSMLTLGEQVKQLQATLTMLQGNIEEAQDKLDYFKQKAKDIFLTEPKGKKFIEFFHEFSAWVIERRDWEDCE